MVHLAIVFPRSDLAFPGTAGADPTCWVRSPRDYLLSSPRHPAPWRTPAMLSPATDCELPRPPPHPPPHPAIPSEYHLTVRQEPKQARMCGVGGKADRRPIDPPPIVQLRVIDPAARRRPSSSAPIRSPSPSRRRGNVHPPSPSKPDHTSVSLPSLSHPILNSPQ